MDEALIFHVKKRLTELALEGADDISVVEALRDEARTAEVALINSSFDFKGYFLENKQDILNYNEKYKLESLVTAILFNVNIETEGLNLMSWCQYCSHLTFQPYYRAGGVNKRVRWYNRGRRPADLKDFESARVCLFSFDDSLPVMTNTDNLLIVERMLFNALLDIDNERTRKEILQILSRSTLMEFLSIMDLYEQENSRFIINS